MGWEYEGQGSIVVMDSGCIMKMSFQAFPLFFEESGIWHFVLQFTQNSFDSASFEVNIQLDQPKSPKDL